MGSCSQPLDCKKRLDFMVRLVVNYNKIKYNNPVAQLVEQHPFKVMVVGSNPTRITNN
jgi:hypothetical protein